MPTDADWSITTTNEAAELPAWLDRDAYPFRNRWVELREGRIHYADEGAGEPILFAHGTPTWSFEWRHLIRALATTYRCVAPDHLGFGLSDRPADASYTPEAHAHRFAEFVARLGLRDFTLVVHDYGGPIALPLALDGHARRLVLLNTWMWSFEGDAGMTRQARLPGSRLGRFLYRRANFSLRVITPSAYADRRKLTPTILSQYLAPFPDPGSRGTVLWALARALLGSSAYYDSLWQRREALRSMPTAIIWGMRDPAFQPHQLKRWQTLLPHARVLELPVGHWPHEEAPESVVGAVRAFLEDS